MDIESSLQATEKLLDVKLTIIDNRGTFRTPEGNPLFGPDRHTHQKHRACKAGFCQACIRHCRHDMNHRGELEKRPFVSCCWKGLQEVVVPLIWEEVHVGSLFAGIWRHPAGVNRPDRKHFSQSVITAYEELKPFPADRAGLIAENLWVYSKGLLRMVGEKLRFSTWNNSNRKAIVSRFMHFNATTAIRLSDLAEELHLTESRTSHLVKELFGKSFQDLVQDQRIAAAKALLLSSDMTVGQVSACVGWSDPQIFSRMFRRQVGTPPGKFRKENSRNSD